MYNIVWKDPNGGYVEEVIQRMITPDSNSSEPLLIWDGISVYCEPTKEIEDEDTDGWEVFLSTWRYYKECGIIDSREAWNYYFLVECTEEQGIWVSYCLDDFWDDACGRGLYSWVERDRIDDPLVGIHFDEENQFQIVNESSLYNFILCRISYTEPFNDYYDNEDFEDLLWAIGEICKIKPKDCVTFLKILYRHWTGPYDMRKEIDDMYSAFFAEPHVPWPY